MINDRQDEKLENEGPPAEEKPLSARCLRHAMEPSHMGSMGKPDASTYAGT